MRATTDRALRVLTLARGLSALRRRADLEALRTASGPAELARRALIPAGRNLGVAVGMLPAGLRDEATASLLACRILDAFEDLGSDRQARTAGVLAATAFLDGSGRAVPLLTETNGCRDSEKVDLLLAHRIRDVRALITSLDDAARSRVERLVRDVGTVMARNLAEPMPRNEYSGGVLGRAISYASALVSDGVAPDPELAAALGGLTQMANDLRDSELELYGVDDVDELARTIFLRLPPTVLAGFALLHRMSQASRSRGARAATAYMVVTTSSFLCERAGASAPYPRYARLGVSMRAALTHGGFARMLARVGESANAAVMTVVADGLPEAVRGAGPQITLFDVGVTGEIPAQTRPSVVSSLLVEATFRLVDELPATPLQGDLGDDDILRMMLADHLAFGALDQIQPDRTAELRELADLFQNTALEGVPA